MNVLLQGDVGSGKTLVALHAALLAVGSGHQAAIMAPTEVLSGQHYRSIGALLEGVGARPFLELAAAGEKQTAQVSLLDPDPGPDSLTDPGSSPLSYALLSGGVLGKDRERILRGSPTGRSTSSWARTRSSRRVSPSTTSRSRWSTSSTGSGCISGWR